MVRRVLIGALSLLALGGMGLVTVPAAFASSNWPLCGTFSLFSEDQCDAIEYYLDDPACAPNGTQPSNIPLQGQARQ